MNNQEIVAKLWNLCNVLRDDGITCTSGNGASLVFQQDL